MAQTNDLKPGIEEDRAKQKAERVDVFRWQRYSDGNGNLWIVTCTFGHDNAGRFGVMVELLDVDNERTVDVRRVDFEEAIRKGKMKRVADPILL